MVTNDPAAERKIAEIVEGTLEVMHIKRDVMYLLSQSQVGINGSRLPVIAKHRISVGRMLMKKPDVMIFHDALAPFDVQDKSTLLRNIREQLPDSTLIWIDREIDDRREFDRVYTLTDDGALSDTSSIAPAPGED